MSITKKLNEVMKSVGWLPKSARNKEQGFDYTPAPELYAYVRPLLANAGLVIIPSILETVQEPVGKTRNGTTIYKTRLKLELTLNAEGFAPLTVAWAGEANDYGDKGINKALTNGTKSFLLSLLLISTGEDPDAESVEPEQTEKRQRGQGETLHRALGAAGLKQSEHYRFAAVLVGQPVASLDDLTQQQAREVYQAAKNVLDGRATWADYFPKVGGKTIEPVSDEEALEVLG